MMVSASSVFMMTLLQDAQNISSTGPTTFLLFAKDPNCPARAKGKKGRASGRSTVRSLHVPSHEMRGGYDVEFRSHKYSPVEPEEGRRDRTRAGSRLVTVGRFSA